jgi:hypothetical protein
MPSSNDAGDPNLAAVDSGSFRDLNVPVRNEVKKIGNPQGESAAANVKLAGSRSKWVGTLFPCFVKSVPTPFSPRIVPTTAVPVAPRQRQWHCPCALIFCVGMRLERLLFPIGMSLWAAVVNCNQVPPAGALAEALRAHVQSERFQIVTSIRGLPLGVRDELRTLFGSYALDIAEPGAEFQATGVVGNSTLPIRRLVAAGCSYDHCLVYYERGGSVRTWKAALFHWTPEATRFEGGGTAPGSLKTVDAVRNAVLSGAIKNPNSVW